MAHSLRIALVVGGTFALAILGFVAYVVNQPIVRPQSGVAYYPQGEPPPFRSPSINGLRLYKSELLGFSLEYPDDLSVLEYGSADNSTITFEDRSGERGFQVYVVPYEGSVVTPERYRLDLESQPMTNLKEIEIDGAHATIFFSKSNLIGDTREVWFIHGGFLYEVTARKDLDAWLAEVMKTWRFI